MLRRLLNRPILAGIGAGIIATAAIALMRSPAPSANAETPAGRPCVQRLMQDWRDGRIDGAYPLPCYQKAIADLPADLRVYSSAVDDIRQARASRIVQGTQRNTRRPS